MELIYWSWTRHHDDDYYDEYYNAIWLYFVDPANANKLILVVVNPRDTAKDYEEQALRNLIAARSIQLMPPVQAT